MPFIPVPMCARVETRLTWNVVNVENVFWARSTILSQEALDALTATVSLWWSEIYRSMQNTLVTHREVYARFMTAPEDLESTNAASAGLQGIVTGDSLPFNCSLCVSLRTGVTGRSARGRFYTIGMSEVDQSNSSATTAYQGAAIGLLTQLRTRINALPQWEFGVVSLYSNGAPRAEGRFLPVTDELLVDQVIDSQRRRLPGRGN